MAARSGEPVDRPDEGVLDRLVTDALGIGLQQALTHLYQTAPSSKKSCHIHKEPVFLACFNIDEML